MMVLFDGSRGAEEILPDAAVIAKEAETTLDLVRVSVPIVAATGMGEVPIVVPGDDPKPYLGDVVARLAAEGIPSRAVALEGRPAAEILEYARANEVGLILMTTHGRTGVRRALVGSVAEEILRHAPCPVLLRRLVPVSEPARNVEHA